MQKVKNVIKLWVLFFMSFFLSEVIYAQKKIEGVYSFLASNQEHYNYFSFDKNGKFEYHKGASLGDDIYGAGHFNISKDTLILNYNLTELIYKSYHKIKEYYNSKDSISVKVIVKDFKGKANINANVYAFKDKVGGIVNDVGEVILRFKKEAGNFILDISNLGYENYKLELSKSKNYVLVVFLNSESVNSRAISDEIVKYKILSLNDKKLKLRTKDNQIITLIKTSKK